MTLQGEARVLIDNHGKKEAFTLDAASDELAPLLKQAKGSTHAALKVKVSESLDVIILLLTQKFMESKINPICRESTSSIKIKGKDTSQHSMCRRRRQLAMRSCSLLSRKQDNHQEKGVGLQMSRYTPCPARG